jgi:glycosyltransferase involved in cell wall biosynthesis
MLPEKSTENQATSVSPLAGRAGDDDAAADLPPVQSEPISTVLPIYNDVATLQPALETWVSVLNGLNRDYELLLVDDASSDSSWELAKTLAEKNQSVRLLHHEAHIGFGSCLRTGLASARFPLVVISTCDGCYQPTDLSGMLKWIDKVHLVAGYRTIDAKRYKRNWAERLFQWINRVIFGLRLKDPECWFLLARRSIFTRILIQSSGPFAFAELLAKANFLGCLMSETPAAYRPSPDTDRKWGKVTLRQKLAGFRRVFSHPDFGPVTVPDE